MQCILHTTACGLGAPLNAAGNDRFAGDTCSPVDVGGVHALVLVGDPRHLPFARAHIGRGHVLRGVDHVSLDQLIGKAARYQLQLVFVIFARINTKPAFRAAEWRVHQSAFICHQGRQRFDFVLVHAKAIANTALHWLHVFGMHRPIAGECLDTAAQAHPETHRIRGIADPDLFLQSRRQIHERDRPVEHNVDAIAKAGFISEDHLFAPVWQSDLCDDASPRRSLNMHGVGNKGANAI